MSDEEQRTRTASLRVKGDARPSGDSQIQFEGSCIGAEDVTIVLTHAYCPNGHDLIGSSSVCFDGQPAIHARLRTTRGSGEIFLSPIHGDPRKKLCMEPEPLLGERLQVQCPTCGVDIPIQGECPSGDLGGLRMLFLNSRLDEGYVALICDVWGCPYSKTLDECSLLSEMVLVETEEE
jgi:hypothetical protein